MACAVNSIRPLTSRTFPMIRRKLHLTPVRENTGRDAQPMVFHQSTAVIITTRRETNFHSINPAKELMAVHKALSASVLTSGCTLHGATVKTHYFHRESTVGGLSTLRKNEYSTLAGTLDGGNA